MRAREKKKIMAHQHRRKHQYAHALHAYSMAREEYRKRQHLDINGENREKCAA